MEKSEKLDNTTIRIKEEKLFFFHKDTHTFILWSKNDISSELQELKTIKQFKEYLIKNDFRLCEFLSNIIIKLSFCFIFGGFIYRIKLT